MVPPPIPAVASSSQQQQQHHHHNNHHHHLRAVRSTGSLRTPHASDDSAIYKVVTGAVPPQNLSHHALSRSPPELSYSKSSFFHSDHDHEGDSLGRFPGESTGGVAVDINSSWRSSRYGDASQDGSVTRGGRIIEPRNQHQHPSTVPSSKYNSKNRVRLDSVFGTNLPGFPYLNSTAAATSGAGMMMMLPHDLRNRASWSERSAGTSGTSASGSQQHQQQQRHPQTSINGHNVDASVSGAEIDTSCSGGSNSSDEVDLDLSFDMDVLRARQRLQQRALAQQNHVKGKAAHVGIDMPMPVSASETSMSSADESAADDRESTRRYRLGGKKRMSKSAGDLRENRRSSHFLRQQYQHQHPMPCATVPSHSGNPAQAKTAASIPARAPPNVHPDTTLDMHDDLADGQLDPPATGEPLGWSYSTTPPLSPAELVSFVEGSSSHRHSNGSSNIASSSATGSRSSSRLLRNRRPSFPLMQILDKAMMKTMTTAAGVAVPVSNLSPASTASWGSPTPTQADTFISPVPGLTRSPEESEWNSPRSPELDTPRTADLNRFSEISASADSSSGGQSDTLRQQAINAIVVAEKAQESHNGGDNASPPLPTHHRRSSSLFRFPFSTVISAFRPASSSLPEQDDTSAESDTTPPAVPTRTAKTYPNAAKPEESNLNRSDTPPSSSTDSHSQQSLQSTPPRLGARVSTIINDTMLRPGPTTGKGRLAGLGLTFGGHPRQSSLPVFSFSAASDDGHQTSDEDHRPQYAVNHRADGGDGDEIEVIASPTPAHASSAPATTLQFRLAHAGEEDAAALDTMAGNSNNKVSMSRFSSSSFLRLPRKVPSPSPDIGLRDRIDRLQPSQLLLLSAFVLGPWCFMLGGWTLRAIDGESPRIKGTICRCPWPYHHEDVGDNDDDDGKTAARKQQKETQDAACDCQAEIYRQIRLNGGKNVVDSATGQPLQPNKMDRYVLTCRYAALGSGTVTMVVAITALIFAGRSW